METRSSHVLVGSVVFALVAITCAFVIWIAGFGAASDKPYDILFKTSVDGIAKGSAVNFSGVPVGKVEEIKLIPDQPELVRVRIVVKEETPVLQGTTATIAGVGFTGVSQINLDGAITGAPAIEAPGPFGAPLIPPKAGGLGAILNNAPALLERLTQLTERLTQTLSPENQKSITGILQNVDRLSSSLADRGPEIAATLVETRKAVAQAGVAAEQMGQLAATLNAGMRDDLKPTLANLNKTVAAARSSMENLDGAISEARPAIKGLTTRTVPEVNELIRNLNEMAEALTSVAGRLDRGGAGGVLGGGSSQLPDYKPRK
ncbi:MlaD family protein [Sphingomonas naphthae]|uniref:MlaD family protein n=1 Tax=Sphingomonas naphthae TaxID=1813468 RepID=A0ABY7TQ47_9SPHN|nr:MlaD family protein [Sphingomonas naphthae]WCT75363.1 MlaD family protein [Sphingomonas naphthae]